MRGRGQEAAPSCCLQLPPSEVPSPGPGCSRRCRGHPQRVLVEKREQGKHGDALPGTSQASQLTFSPRWPQAHTNPRGRTPPTPSPAPQRHGPVSPLPFLPHPGLNGSPNNTWGASQTAGGGWDCKHTQRCFIIFRPQNPFPPFGSTPCLESRLLAAKRAPLGCLLPDPEAEHPVPSQNTLQVEFWLYKSPRLGRWLQPNGSVLLRQECGTAAPDTDPGRAPRCSLCSRGLSTAQRTATLHRASQGKTEPNLSFSSAEE